MKESPGVESPGLFFGPLPGFSLQVRSAMLAFTRLNSSFPWSLYLAGTAIAWLLYALYAAIPGAAIVL